jgi:ComF family protein
MLPTARTFIDAFLHLLFPEACVVCKRVLNAELRFVCPSCRLALPYTDFFKDLQQHIDNPAGKVLIGRIPADFVLPFLHFQKGGSAQKILHAIKYRGAKALAYEMGYLYGERLCRASLPYEIDGFLPVPLHPKKQHQRGYNQSEYFARGLADAWQYPLPVWNRAVERRVQRASQTHKGLWERWLNVRDVFELTTEGKRALHRQAVVLVDDVLTTGATLEALYKSILPAQPRAVGVITLAYAGDAFA